MRPADAKKQARRIATSPASAPRSLDRASPRHDHRAAQQAEGRTAIIVIHGMGQQNRSDSLSEIAEIVYQNSGAESDLALPPLTLVERSLTDDVSAVSADMVIPCADGYRHVSVFEVYWAPIAEGKISFGSSLLFLVTAGLFGLIQIVRDWGRFLRWQFGKLVEFKTEWTTALQLTVALAAALGFGILFVAFALGLAAKVSGLMLAGMLPSPPFGRNSFALINDLDTIVAWFTVVAGAAIGVGVLTAGAVALVQRLGGARWLPTGLLYGWMCIWAGVVVLAAAAGGASAVGAVTLHGSAFSTQRRGVDSAWSRAIVDKVQRWSWWTDDGNGRLGMNWVLFAIDGVIFFVLYRFVTQFIGDVAIYISAHRVSRYWETRESIRRTAHSLASAVYSASDGGQPRYDSILFVAHSLGSVIAYDTVNAVIRDQTVFGRYTDAVARTRGLLTYGSPLDKIAFLFRAYSRNSITRMAAAAATQPLIVDAMFRRFDWVNIYAGADWISGPLDFYDSPDVRVRNVRDDAAYIPLLAHTQYESHPTFTKELLRMVTAAPPARSA